MPTVGDLSRELRCTVSDVQRAARLVGVSAKTPDFELRGHEYRLVRDKYLELRAAWRSEEAARAEERMRESSPSIILLPDREVDIRGAVGPVAGATAVGLRLHQDFLDWLWSDQTDSRLKRRANLVLRQLAAFGRTSIVKSVRGVARGWRRSPLGGNQGRQFYMWWAPMGAPPIADFDLPKDTVVVRAVRHHDETSTALPAGSVASDYIELNPSDLVNQQTEYGYAFNESQAQIAHSRSSVRFIKGHPGAGKTTALWLAASLVEGHRALYLTYNKKLALDAEQYFRALGPQALSLEVLTFDQLTAHLLQVGDARPLPQLSDDEASDEFEDVIAGNYRAHLGPWDGRIDELYAELHAHAVGQALPIPFRGIPPTDGLVMPRMNYVALREEALGGQGARKAAQVAAQLATSNLIEQLFPGPARAHRALDRLRTDPSAIKRFVEVDCVFVDECQDLTLVELQLLVRLCAEISVAADRPPPLFVAAGDEGQTVRPSDFEWGQLADLTASQIGRRSEFDLPGNVRCPQSIAQVVNRSWDMYRQFAKEDRPRGYAAAEIEEASHGRLIYTVCRTLEELRDIVTAFDTIPNATLVYPGYRVPEPYLAVSDTTTDVILTSRSAKGLDFQTVGVLDAGKQMARLRDLAKDAESDGRLSTLWGRVMADHLRVGLSRATENLVLIDLNPDPSAVALIDALCEDVPKLEMEPDELVTFLSRDESDAAELALEFCEEVEKLIGNQRLRAYRRSRQAVALLGDPKSPNAVQDAAVRRQAWTLRGVAAFDLMRQKSTRGKDQYPADELLKDTVAAFRRAERGSDANAVQLVSRLGGAAPLGVISEVRELLALLQDLERHIERIAREVLVSWCADAAATALPTISSTQAALLDTVRGIVKEIGPRHPELAQHLDRLLSALASAARAEGRFEDALATLSSLSTREPASEALCHEHLGNNTAAARLYETVGDFNAAIRTLRRVPDVVGALRLARLLNHEDLPVLEWLRRYTDVMASLEPHVAAMLTEAERRLVGTIRDDAVIDASAKAQAEPQLPSGTTKVHPDTQLPSEGTTA